MTPLICLGAFVAYLGILLWLEVEPISDYQEYYRLGEALAGGQKLGPLNLFFQPPGYFLLLAMVFRTLGHGSVLAPQILNAAMLCAAACILFSSRTPDSERFSRFALVLFLTSLNAWLMVPVLGTEVLYSVLFLLGLHVLLLGFASVSAAEPRRRIATCRVAAGILLGLSQAVRPVTVPFLAILLCVVVGLPFIRALLHRRFDREGWVAHRTLVVPIAVVLLVAVGASMAVYSASGYGLRISPIGSGAWSRFVAFSPHSAKGLSEADQVAFRELHQERGSDLAALKRGLAALAAQRFADGWSRQLARAPKRLVYLVNSATLTQWSIDVSPQQPQRWLYPIVRVLRVIAVLVAAICAAASLRWLVRPEFGVTQTVFVCLTIAALGYITAHSYFLEVQARYSNHLWLMVFWLSPVAFSSLLSSLRQRWRHAAESHG